MNSLGFGIERLGLWAIRAPIVALLVVVALSLAAVFGVLRLQPDDALSDLFKSSTSEYADYKAMSDRFPVSEFDVLIVVEGEGLLDPADLEEVRNLHYELELSQGVAGVLSVFSMRDPPDETGFPPPMIPEPLPEGDAFAELMERVGKHPLMGGRFITLDNGNAPPLTVVVVSMEPEALSYQSLSGGLDGLERTVADVLGHTSFQVQFAGAPIMQREIRDAIRSDQIVYNGVGLAVGILICVAFFRRIDLVLIASVCPLLAVLWALGVLGWLDLKLNTFLNVIPPLVMVIAFSDAMHMVFSFRRNLAQGMDRFASAREAVLTVGPACVLTSITTALALAALAITDSALIRTFALSAAGATLMAFITVIVVVPAACVLVFRNEEKFRGAESTRGGGIRWLQALCESLAGIIKQSHRPIALVGIATIVAMSALHLQLEPQYRLSDEVPNQNQSVGSSARLDEQLTGAFPLHIMLEWDESLTLTDPKVLSAIADAHRLHESHPSVGNVWSLETLRRWLQGIGVTSVEELDRYVKLLPEHLVGRFVNPEAHSALVTGRLPNLDANESVPIMRDLQEDLQELATAHPDVTFRVTGLTALSSLQSANMIGQLNLGLLTAVGIVVLIIGLAFRSFKMAVLSLLPNLFPIVAAGSVLYVVEGGLAYASVIALTVGFGLAVDDSIHFLNRFQRETERLGSAGEGVIETIARIGPVLILTTFVLLVGLAVTMASDLPSMQLFGLLTMLTLFGALVADLIILPAIVMSLSSRKRGSSGVN